MGSLSRDHWLALLTAVAEIHGARVLAGFPGVAIRAVRKLVPCDMVSFNTIEPACRRMRSVSEPAGLVASPGTLEILASHMHEHPLLAHHHASGDSRSVMLSDLVTRRQFRDSTLYREFYGPLGIAHQMTAAVALGGNASVGIALSRCGTGFTEQERELLEIVRPHLRQAYVALVGGRRATRSPGQPARTPAANRGLAHPALTPRETEIIEGLAGGASNDELGDALGISSLTVKKHLEHIYRKLGVRRRGAAVARFRSSEAERLRRGASGPGEEPESGRVR